MRASTQNRIDLLTRCICVFALALLVGVGCNNGEDDNNGGTTDSGTDVTDDDTGDEDTGNQDVGDTGDEDTGDSGFGFSTGNPGDNPGDFTQVDRIGMPAVSTALISSKTAYNQASPTDDANGDYAGELVGAVAGLHSDSIDIDSDLESLNLVPCTMDDPASANGQCVSQDILANAGGGGPSPAALVIPDTLKINVTQDAGFPNGRALADPVIDVTLAIILLDMTADTTGADPQAQTPFAFTPGNIVGPLNPPTNDVGDGTFPSEFPYLHDAQ